MGEAAVLSLNAIGGQDTYLDGDDGSLFNYKTTQHSNFTIFQRSIKVEKLAGVNNWPFGQTVQVRMKPQSMGDLMCNMYIKMSLPRLPDAESRVPGKYCDQIGKSLLNKATFRVDEYELENIHGDWMFIYDELYRTEEEKDALKDLVNGGANVGELNSSGPIDVYIPIPFFFCRKHNTGDTDNKLIFDNYFKPYFPLCAVHKQELFFNFEFNPIGFFTNSSQTTSERNSKPLEIPRFELVIEEVTLSPIERGYLVNNKQTIMTELVRRQSTIDIPINDPEIKNNLVPNIPVKCLHWFFRRDEFEVDALTNPIQTSLLYQNRHNFSSVVTSNLETQLSNPIMTDAQLFIDGLQNLGFMGKTNGSDNYFKFQVPLKCSLSAPKRNIYTYSFALKPKEPTPSGTVNFSQLNSDKTFLQPLLKQGVSTVVVGDETFPDPVIPSSNLTVYARATGRADGVLTVEALTDRTSNITISVNEDELLAENLVTSVTDSRQTRRVVNTIVVDAVENANTASRTLTLNMPPTSYNMSLFYTGYQILDFEYGFLTPKFSTA